MDRSSTIGILASAGTGPEVVSEAIEIPEANRGTDFQVVAKTVPVCAAAYLLAPVGTPATVDGVVRGSLQQ